jgi:hypothetical protein
MCPGKQFNLLPPTEHISLMQPKAYAYGGMVLGQDVNIPNGILNPNDPDKVLARLMPGELIIPLPHVKRVKTYLKSQGIRLPRT